MKSIFYIFLCLASVKSAVAMPIKVQTLKPRVFFQKVDQDLLLALDLNAKTLTFTAADSERCGVGLLRRARSLTYTCTLPIPTKSKVSKLQSSGQVHEVEVTFGGTKRKVLIEVAPDARSVSFTTAFDATGIDFEISKFNDDFFKIYDKVALLIISEAQARQTLRIEVLESRS